MIIEAKQGRFQPDRYRPFALQHGSLVYNPKDQEWIPNATDNHWANCPGRNPEHEHHVIHTLGWSLQLTNITLTFDVKSESIYYGKIRIKCDLEKDYCPPNHAIKATVFREPETHCRIFDVARSNARMIKFQKRYPIETLKYNETNSGQKNTPHMYSCRFQKQLYEETQFLVSRFSQNFYTNVMKTAHVMPHNTKTFLFNTKKVLTL